MLTGEVENNRPERRQSPASEVSEDDSDGKTRAVAREVVGVIETPAIVIHPAVGNVYSKPIALACII